MNNNTNTEEELLISRRKGLHDLLNEDIRRYMEFYRKQLKTTDKSVMRENIETLSNQLNDEIKKINITQFNAYTNIYGKNLFKNNGVNKSRKLRGPNNYANSPEEAQYEQDERPYLDISMLYDDKLYNNKNIKKERDEFGSKTFDKLGVGINRNMLGWKSLDPLQDNIGSIESLTEFFFNFMMCYYSPYIISKNEKDFEANKDKYTKKPADVNLKDQNGLTYAGFYLPLPDEWTIPGGILDQMMKDTKERTLLKIRGIPIHVNTNNPNVSQKFKDYIKAQICSNDGYATVSGAAMRVPYWEDPQAIQANQNRHIVTPYITQPVSFTSGNARVHAGQIGGESWESLDNAVSKGGYYRVYPVNSDNNNANAGNNTPNPCVQVVRDSFVNNNTTIADINSGNPNAGGGGFAGFLGYGTTGNRGINSATVYNGTGGLYTNSGGAGMAITGAMGTPNINLGGYFSNIHRTIYDMIYSNPAFIVDERNRVGVQNSASKNFLLGLDARYIIGGNYASGAAPAKHPGNLIGGLVNINGLIPSTNYTPLNSAMPGTALANPITGARTNVRGEGLCGLSSIPGTFIGAQPAPPAPGAAFVPASNYNAFRFTNTARSAYNTIFLKKFINHTLTSGAPPINFNLDNVIDVNKYQYNKIAINTRDITITSGQGGMKVSSLTGGGNPTGTIFAAGLANSTSEAIQNLWIGNAGGYAAMVSVDSGTPIGLLTARYNTSETANGDLTQNYPVPDSIPNDDVIEAVIWKFANIIFDGIKDNYLADNNEDSKKYFTYRLSRSLITIKNSLFCAPIFKEVDKSIVKSFTEAVPGQNLVNKYYGDGASYSIENVPGSLFTTQANIGAPDFDQTDDLKKRQNSQTYCKDSQPITLSLTNVFKNAFKKMMNKAILMRHATMITGPGKIYTYEDLVKLVNEKNKDDTTQDIFGNKRADELIEDDAYIAGCTGKCFDLVQLDVSSILEMKDGAANFNYYDYLRTCLNTDKNILKYNFDFNNNKTFRPCSAGIIQSKDSLSNEYLNYKSTEELRNYFQNFLFLSKMAFLRRVKENMQDVERNKKTIEKVLLTRAGSLISPLISKMQDAILNDKPYIYNSSLAVIDAKYKGALKDYKKFLTEYNARDDQLSEKISELSKLIEKETDIDYERVADTIEFYYNKKQELIDDFEKNHNKYVSMVVVIIDKLKEFSDKLKKGDVIGVSKIQSTTISGNLDNMIDKLLREGEVTVPGLLSEFIDQTTLEQLSNLGPYITYINADPVLRGGIWIPISKGLIAKLKNKFGITKTTDPNKDKPYRLFNIISGELVSFDSKKENIDKVKSKIREGVVLVSSSRTSDKWFFSRKDPFKDNFNNKDQKNKSAYLKDYRRQLFETYGEYNTFDQIGLDELSKFIAKVFSDTYEVKDNPIEYCRHPNKCRTIYFDELKKRLLRIISEHRAPADIPTRMLEKVQETKNRNITGKVGFSGGKKKIKTMKKKRVMNKKTKHTKTCATRKRVNKKSGSYRKIKTARGTRKVKKIGGKTCPIPSR